MSQSPTAVPEGVETGDAAGKYLTFSLGGEAYGIPILKVQEIIAMLRITPVPRTPPFVRGVINLRGKVIPIVDLRLRFGMPAADYTEQTCIIVVEARGMEIGVVVDRVCEVADIPASSIEPPPSLAVDAASETILGIGKTGDRVTLLLHVDRVVSSEEAVALESVAETTGC